MTTNGINVGPGYRREEVTVQQQGGTEHQERIVENKGAEKRLFIYRVNQFIWLLFGVLEGLIGFRILFRLIDANPANPFAHFIYQLTGLFVKPFSTLVVNPASSGMVLEITSLVAMLVYGLLAWVIVALVCLIFFPTRTRTVSIINKERRP